MITQNLLIIFVTLFVFFICLFLVEEHIKDQLEAAKPAPVVEEVDLMNLAPRKPDW